MASAPIIWGMSTEGIGGRIRQARKAKGIAQVDLATAAGVRQHTMWRYEKGDIKQPSPDVLAKIADHLGVSLRWLTTGVGLESLVPAIVEADDHRAWIILEEEGYIDFARREGVREEVIQWVRRYPPDAATGLTPELLRERLEREIMRARSSAWRREHAREGSEITQATTERERRKREGKKNHPLKAPDEND